MKDWVASTSPGELFLSVIVLGEIRRGIERLRTADPAQAGQLERWLDELATRFAGRVLPVDRVTAETWGRLGAIRPVPIENGLLAATALVRGLTLVTRNVTDVDGLGVPLLNPWD